MGFLSGIGGLVNDVLGGTSSAKMANQHSEKMAKNAHQWEVQDLKKAGLNPALSAGGSSAGAIAGAGGNIGSTNGNIGDIVGAVGTLSQMKLNNASSAKAGAETAEIIKGLPYVEPQKEAAINNQVADTALKEQQQKESKANQKYQNERARGYSESTSEQSSYSGEGGAFGFKAGGSKSSAKSHSRTY